MYNNHNFVDCNRLSILDDPPRHRVITLRPGPSSSLEEITLIGAPRPQAGPREITLVAEKYNSFIKIPEVDPLSYPAEASDARTTRKIPRPPNAFMIFANEWRKRLAAQNPLESNKAISVRLGHMWKNMDKSSKDIYYQRSRLAGQAHKLKYPGYVYNPKEARIRKALREQSRGVRNPPSITPARWNKLHPLTMNRQSLISPVLLQQQPHVTEDSKAMLHEQVEREHSMLQSYPDYVDLPYNVPSNDYPLDTQNWYPSPYLQGGGQANGAYLNRTEGSKLPVDWSTPYSSEQGNFIRASPQSSPYSMQNHSEVNSLMLNGDGGHQEQPTTPCDTNCLLDHKPVMDPVISQNGTSPALVAKDPEQQVKELLASAKVITDDSPLVNGKQEDAGSMKLPGFHQAFGSTEIGRFSQPDGFFEAAVAAENERKSPGLPTQSPSPTSPWACSYFPCPDSSTQDTDLFGFQENEDQPFLSYEFNEPNHLYMLENNFGDSNRQIFFDETIFKTEPASGSEEFQSQDLSTVTNLSQPPVIISQNDNCCVVLESSVLDNDVKEYFSL